MEYGPKERNVAFAIDIRNTSALGHRNTLFRVFFVRQNDRVGCEGDTACVCFFAAAAGEDAYVASLLSAVYLLPLSGSTFIAYPSLAL